MNSNIPINDFVKEHSQRLEDPRTVEYTNARIQDIEYSIGVARTMTELVGEHVGEMNLRNDEEREYNTRVVASLTGVELQLDAITQELERWRREVIGAE